MTQNLAGKVALVTGSGRGIGRCIALKLASEGARLVINDLEAGPAEEVAALIRERGGEAVTCVGSVTAPDFADRFIKTALQSFQGLDIIVNNAGYTWDSVIQKMSDEQWYAMMDVHLSAPFRILRAAQPVLRNLSKAKQEQGRKVFRKVVNISSIAGLGGNAGQVNYAAAKAGMLGMIRTRLTEAVAGGDATIRIEGRDIKVGISPDLARTFESGIPLGRAGTPEEAADAVYLLCTPESNYISGQTVVCGGGLAL